MKRNAFDIAEHSSVVCRIRKQKKGRCYNCNVRNQKLTGKTARTYLRKNVI